MVASQQRYLTWYLCVSSQVSVERGMSWEEATHAWAEQNGPDDGFYVQVREMQVMESASWWAVFNVKMNHDRPATYKKTTDDYTQSIHV